MTSIPYETNDRYKGYSPIRTLDLMPEYMQVFDSINVTMDSLSWNVCATMTDINLLLVEKNDNPEDSSKRKLAIHPGYQLAIWELKHGDLRWCPSQHALWRRDADTLDHEGGRYTLNSWHQVPDIEREYMVGDKRSRDYNTRISRTIMRESQRSQWFRQVKRGIRIGDTVWYREGDSPVTHATDGDMATMQTFPQQVSDSDSKQAREYFTWLTKDAGSRDNLLRMPATPWLEPETHRQFMFILSGHGGDGKSLIATRVLRDALGMDKVLPTFKVRDWCDPKFSFGRQQIAGKLVGKAFGYDDEARTGGGRLVELSDAFLDETG